MGKRREGCERHSEVCVLVLVFTQVAGMSHITSIPCFAPCVRSACCESTNCACVAVQFFNSFFFLAVSFIFKQFRFISFL